MFRGRECDQGIIEAIGLPGGTRFTPVATMARQAHDEFVMSPVLIGLIGVSGTTVLARHNPGRAQERYTKSVVVGLIRAVLAVGEDGRAEAATFVGEIDPTVRGDFKLA